MKGEAVTTCGAPDGICQTIWRGAGCTEGYDSVCGCDGQSYETPCEAEHAQVGWTDTGAGCP